MQFNLIDEEWIPVKRRDGTETRITPWQVTDGFAENPIVSLNAPRPDFNGSLIQFLIGLVQTTFAPAHPIEWKQKLKTPPSPNQLKDAFMTVQPAFELGGDKARFMQIADSVSEMESIESLLIGTPGQKTCEDNKDHFVKRNQISAICPSCSASAIFTLHCNASAGGRGYMTSLRGGGPLTTLIIGDERFDSLWHTIWLNVLDNRIFLNLCNSNKNAIEESFPWMGNIKAKLTEQDIHPSQYYWAMPRRVRLYLGNLISGICDVCSKDSGELISKYQEEPNGTKYVEPMKHPLSPFNTKSTKAVLTQPGGLGYRHWLGLVTLDTTGGKEPARVVHEFIDRQESNWEFRLWAFGYDFVPKQDKARCWYEAKMPLNYVAASIRGEYEQLVANLIKSSTEIAGNARSAIKEAWFRRPGEVKGDMFFVDSMFWQNTESIFYETLSRLKIMLESSSDSIVVRSAWHKALCDEALRIFDMLAWNGPVEDTDPKRIVIARKELQTYNNGKKIKELLGLPIPKKSTKEKKKKLP